MNWVQPSAAAMHLYAKCTIRNGVTSRRRTLFSLQEVEELRYLTLPEHKIAQCHCQSYDSPRTDWKSGQRLGEGWARLRDHGPASTISVVSEDVIIVVAICGAALHSSRSADPPGPHVLQHEFAAPHKQSGGATTLARIKAMILHDPSRTRKLLRRCATHSATTNWVRIDRSPPTKIYCQPVVEHPHGHLNRSTIG